MSWEHIGTQELPRELSGIGLGAAPVLSHGAWYMREGAKVLRARAVGAGAAKPNWKPIVRTPSMPIVPRGASVRMGLGWVHHAADGTHYATGLASAGSVQSELGSLQGSANIAPYADSDGSYTTYITDMQGVGNTAVGTLGPDIDSTYGIANTGSYTQAAWGANSALAAVNSSSTSTASDASIAQGYVSGMANSYQQAVAAGQAAGGGGVVHLPGSQPANVVSAAQAAAAAIAADSSYCTSVGRTGSAVNVAVHAFKTAWNAANANNKVPVGTGQFEAATAAAMSSALGGGGPAACAGGGGGYVPPAPPPPLPVPPGTIATTGAPSSTNWAPIVIVGALAIGGAVIGIAAYEKRAKRKRRLAA